MEVKIVGNVISYENMNVGDYFRYIEQATNV